MFLHTQSVVGAGEPVSARVRATHRVAASCHGIVRSIAPLGAFPVKRLLLSSAVLAMAAGLTGTIVMQRATAAPVHATVLPTPDDSLRKLVLKFHVVGSFESLD